MSPSCPDDQFCLDSLFPPAATKEILLKVQFQEATSTCTCLYLSYLPEMSEYQTNHYHIQMDADAESQAQHSAIPPPPPPPAPPHASHQHQSVSVQSDGAGSIAVDAAPLQVSGLNLPMTMAMPNLSSLPSMPSDAQRPQTTFSLVGNPQEEVVRTVKVHKGTAYNGMKHDKLNVVLPNGAYFTSSSLFPPLAAMPDTNWYVQQYTLDAEAASVRNQRTAQQRQNSLFLQVHVHHRLDQPLDPKVPFSTLPWFESVRLLEFRACCDGTTKKSIRHKDPYVQRLHKMFRMANVYRYSWEDQLPDRKPLSVVIDIQRKSDGSPDSQASNPSLVAQPRYATAFLRFVSGVEYCVRVACSRKAFVRLFVLDMDAKTWLVLVYLYVFAGVLFVGCLGYPPVLIAPCHTLSFVALTTLGRRRKATRKTSPRTTCPRSAGALRPMPRCPTPLALPLPPAPGVPVQECCLFPSLPTTPTSPTFASWPCITRPSRGTAKWRRGKRVRSFDACCDCEIR